MKFSNSEEYIKRLKDTELFMLDMDGTFNLGMRLIDGAMDFYNAVVDAGKKVVFLTNNSSRDGNHYVEKLNKLGCPVTIDDVYTSGMATCEYILRHHSGDRVYLLGNDYLKSEFGRCGILLTDDNPDLVTVGYDTTFDYEKMCVVCDFLREDIPYIATHPDVNCPTETGFVPDIGAIIEYIKTSTGRGPDIIIGKPYEPIMQNIIHKLDLDRSKVAICGDRLYTDIAAGVNYDILSICVLSGETTKDDIDRSLIVPDLVFDSLKDMIKHIK